MKIRTKRTALYAWLPVLCLVALSLSTAPGSSEARQAGNLSISPKEFYGGQGVTFKGNIGTAGKRSVWLEFHMGRAGDDWTRIEGSTRETEADGSFDFVFPARGMNNIKLRVAAAGGLATDPVNFTAHDQAATVSMQPADLNYNDSECGGSFLDYLSYDAVATEGYTLTVDSTPRGEPVLNGRGVTLERRVSGGKWQQVDTGTINNSGKATFNLTAPAGNDETAYRARLAEWSKDGSQIGWYPSFPTYVESKVRPVDVTGLDGADPNPGDDPTYVYPEDLAIEWDAVGGSADDVVIAWNQGNNAPDRPGVADGTVTRQETADRFELNGLEANTKYSFALFARSGAGICSQPVEKTLTTDAEPTPPAVTGLSASLASATWPTVISLQWNPPTGQALERVYLQINGSYLADLDISQTTYTVPDWMLSPDSDYQFGIYTTNRWGKSSPVALSGTIHTPAVTP